MQTVRFGLTPYQWQTAACSSVATVQGYQHHIRIPTLAFEPLHVPPKAWMERMQEKQLQVEIPQGGESVAIDIAALAGQPRARQRAEKRTTSSNKFPLKTRPPTKRILEGSFETKDSVERKIGRRNETDRVG